MATVRHFGNPRPPLSDNSERKFWSYDREVLGERDDLRAAKGIATALFGTAAVVAAVLLFLMIRGH